MEFLYGSINDLSHTNFRKQRDFKELGRSQCIFKDIIDFDFKELKIATWLKNRMGEVINRPIQKPMKTPQIFKKC